MIQKKWFRIETDASGAILSCEEVSSKGRQGAIVRYYEALTKADACKQAKEWAARYRSICAASQRKTAHEAKEKGLCIRCRVNPLVNASHCESCREKARAEHVELRKRRKRGEPVRTPMPADKLRERVAQEQLRYKRKWGGARPYEYARLLKRIDTMGREELRQWVRRKILKLGGAAAVSALEEYERDYEKAAFENASKIYQEQHPKSYAQAWDEAQEDLDSAAE